MKSNKCFFMILAGLLALFLGNKPAFCTTYYVPDNYPTIQAAVNAALEGDTVVVRAGTYTGVGNRDILINKIITVKSEEGPENTIIDCQQAGRGFTFSNVGSTPVLEGFQIINGKTTYDGGGISCSYASPLITNCLIKNNTACGGGGIYLEYSHPEIRYCQINENIATLTGGGIYLRLSNPEIRYCQINMNSVSVTDSSSGGGGIYLAHSHPEIRYCQINENIASSGGGIYLNMPSSALEISNCQIIKNRATLGGGGGICFYGGNPSPSLLLTNCAIISNSAGTANGGGVLFGFSSPIITHCTFAWNRAGKGGGIYSFIAPTTITNSIFFFDSGPDEIYLSNSHATVTNSNIMGGYTGEGNINANPEFVANGDFHLSALSPCIDTANPVNAPATDIDGELRPQGAGYDMGADEFDGITLNKADLNGDGVVDGLDVSLFAKEFGKIY